MKYYNKLRTTKEYKHIVMASINKSTELYRIFQFFRCNREQKLGYDNSL